MSSLAHKRMWRKVHLKKYRRKWGTYATVNYPKDVAPLTAEMLRGAKREIDKISGVPYYPKAQVITQYKARLWSKQSEEMIWKALMITGRPISKVEVKEK